MPEPGETPATEPDSFRLSCGAEKTNLKRGWWSISDGAFHPETPSGIIYSLQPTAVITSSAEL